MLFCFEPKPTENLKRDTKNLVLSHLLLEKLSSVVYFKVNLKETQDVICFLCFTGSSSLFHFLSCLFPNNFKAPLINGGNEPPLGTGRGSAASFSCWFLQQTFITCAETNACSTFNSGVLHHRLMTQHLTFNSIITSHKWDQHTYTVSRAPVWGRGFCYFSKPRPHFPKFPLRPVIN